MAWKTHVITLCDEHLIGYRDACDCMYRKAMGLGGEAKWKDDKWAQLYADRKAFIEQQMSSVPLGTGPGSSPPQKRARTSPKSTKNHGTQTESVINADFGYNCDETLPASQIEVPASPDYALEAEAQKACSGWTEQDPDEAVKRWNDNLKPLPKKAKKSKYAFIGDE